MKRKPRRRSGFQVSGNGRLLHLEDTGGEVERRLGADGEGAIAVSVTDGQAVDARDVEGGQALLQHLLDRRRVLVLLLAAQKVAEDHGPHAVERAGELELREHPVDAIWP